jgi:hypothetical protein
MLEILELFKQHSQVAFSIIFSFDLLPIYSAVRRTSCSMPEGFLR